MLTHLKGFYKENIDQFICDWGMTADPRNAERNLPVVIPFVLFERQREWIHWLVERWRGQEDGLVEKSRDMGLSWLSVAAGASLCLFYDDVNIGFGSRKEEYVDKIGDPKSLFFKARQFLELLPPEFSGGWKPSDASHMVIKFPGTSSTLTGEAGDNIGRGNRAAIYFKDESAFYERPDLIEAALSQTSNCKIDISTVNGAGNPFHRKRFSGKIPVFVFDWRQDPRKDDAWYQRQVDTLDPKTVAQEIDRDYNASVEGVCIPGKYVQAAVNLAEKMDYQATGVPRASLDVADEEGKDDNVAMAGIGSFITDIENWKGLDTTQSTFRTESFALDNKATFVSYDSIGVGAGVRGASKTSVLPFYGVATSSKELRGAIPGDSSKLRKDFYINLRSQLWWEMRIRFERTFQHVNGIKQWSMDDMISIPNHSQLISELSQPLYDYTDAGKIQIESKKAMKKRGIPSPNYADALMLLFAPISIKKRQRQAASHRPRRGVYE